MIKKSVLLVLCAIACGVGFYVFASKHVFKAHLADGWYPHDSTMLQALLEHAQHDSEKRCALYKLKSNNVIQAIVAPHAGYRYAADIAVAAYKLLKEQHINRVIILAPSHTQLFTGVALPHFTKYQTPLGVLSVDEQAIAHLKKHPLYQVHDTVWSQEHALEMQLPYIQYYIGNQVTIVPLIISQADAQQLQQIASALIDLIDETTVVVISSDFVHYGARFNYTPFNAVADVQSAIKELDMHIINTLLDNDAQAFSAFVNHTQATVCGKVPLELFKVLQTKLSYALIGKLLCYKTSYEVDPSDVHTSVSYASIIFERPRIIALSAHEKQRIIQEVRRVMHTSCDGSHKEESSTLADIQALQAWQGLFITLRTKDGQLRGCMGSVIPDKPLIQLLPEVARLTAFSDPRFAPISCAQIDDLSIEVSVLEAPQTISNYRDIVLGKHGIILSMQDKSALFLPKVAIEQQWDLPTTLSYLAQKAGLASDAWQQPNVRFQVFSSYDF